MAGAFQSLSIPSNNNNSWCYTRQQMDNNPSRLTGLHPDKELSYRRQAANLIQDMGQQLNVSQLTINTAIVYMHRFYMIQSFTRFHRNAVAPAALFLAAKVEEQPRRLEHVVRVAHACLSPQAYLPQVRDLVNLENIILQTLGFEIVIEHPHIHVIKWTQLVGVSTELAKEAYLMATHSLLLTTFCLQYSPSVVACVCIHLASKRVNCGIAVSTDGKLWWEIVDPTVTLELLDDLTRDFLEILEKTPSPLRAIHNWRRPQSRAEHVKMPPSTENRKATHTERCGLPPHAANPPPGPAANSKAAVNNDQLKRAEGFSINKTFISQKRPQSRAEHFKMPASTESRKATHTARFGLTPHAANPSPGPVANSKAAVNNDQLKRAERFSMNTTSISQKVEEGGWLKKRKERCWISSAGSAGKCDVEAKKMRRD